MDPNSDVLTMELEPAADMIIREFWNYESELIAERGSGDNETIISWIGKLHGKALRVSALIALPRQIRRDNNKRGCRNGRLSLQGLLSSALHRRK